MSETLNDKDRIEDMWARMFALYLGTQAPKKKCLTLFTSWVIMQSRNRSEPITDDFIGKQFVTFLNHLSER